MPQFESFPVYEGIIGLVTNGEVVPTMSGLCILGAVQNTEHKTR